MIENKQQDNTVELSRAEKCKARYEARKEELLKRGKARYYANREEFARQSKAYYEANKERCKNNFKAWNEANKERCKEYSRAYLKTNGNIINARKKEKMANDDVYCAKIKLRWLVASAFNRIKQNKSAPTITILGCSWQEAKQHFEALFQPGMSWQNHGAWHIDHIVPVASATTIEEVTRLNHISNLQPLWAKDNRSKGCKILS